MFQKYMNSISCTKTQKFDYSTDRFPEISPVEPLTLTLRILTKKQAAPILDTLA